MQMVAHAPFEVFAINQLLCTDAGKVPFYVMFSTIIPDIAAIVSTQAEKSRCPDMYVGKIRM